MGHVFTMTTDHDHFYEHLDWQLFLMRGEGYSWKFVLKFQVNFE